MLVSLAFWPKGQLNIYGLLTLRLDYDNDNMFILYSAFQNTQSRFTIKYK